MWGLEGDVLVPSNPRGEWMPLDNMNSYAVVRASSDRVSLLSRDRNWPRVTFYNGFDTAATRRTPSDAFCGVFLRPPLPRPGAGAARVTVDCMTCEQIIRNYRAARRAWTLADVVAPRPREARTRITAMLA